MADWLRQSDSEQKQHFANEKTTTKKRHSRRLHASVYSKPQCAKSFFFFFIFEAICSFRTSHDTWHSHTHKHTAVYSSPYSVFWCVQKRLRILSANPLPQHPKPNREKERYTPKTSIGCAAQVTCCLRATDFRFLATGYRSNVWSTSKKLCISNWPHLINVVKMWLPCLPLLRMPSEKNGCPITLAVAKS